MSSHSGSGSSQAARFGGNELKIVGMGVKYPPHVHTTKALETLAKRYHPESTAMSKVLSINRLTGVDTRSSIGDINHPIVNQPEPATVDQLSDLFFAEGIPMSVAAGNAAIEEWGGPKEAITHVVSTTCTHSANPGFDHYVVKEMGLDLNVEKALLHGVGCSGGLAALRTAANLALGASHEQRPARILVLACEITTTFARSELDTINKEQKVNIGATLFSDCASAVVLSNGVGSTFDGTALYHLLGWQNKMIPNTEQDLRFDLSPQGWKVILSNRVPKKASICVGPIFEELVAQVPGLIESGTAKPADFDWALHPGGLTVLTGVQKAVGLTDEHMRASIDTYINHGNSSSATIFSVMDKLRKMGPGREHVVGTAFGPGLGVEMMILKRVQSSDSQNSEEDTSDLVGKPKL